MRSAIVLLLAFLATVAGCRQILGIEDARLLCPPELPDCMLCYNVADCGSATECHSWRCVDNLCRPTNKSVGTKCTTGVCSDDPVSVCVACMAYEDCPGGQCRDHRCSRCDDGIKNGWEEDVDCGGGSPCKRCLGSACSTPDDCKSGFCADGTCCNSACDAICAYCTMAGDCEPIPRYTNDPVPVCAGENTCDGFGSCLLQPGEICVNAVECASARCEQNRCRKLAGEDCIAPQECANDLCVSGKCQN